VWIVALAALVNRHGEDWPPLPGDFDLGASGAMDAARWRRRKSGKKPAAKALKSAIQ